MDMWIGCCFTDIQNGVRISPWYPLGHGIATWGTIRCLKTIPPVDPSLVAETHSQERNTKVIQGWCLVAFSKPGIVKRGQSDHLVVGEELQELDDRLGVEWHFAKLYLVCINAVFFNANEGKALSSTINRIKRMDSHHGYPGEDWIV